MKKILLCLLGLLLVGCNGGTDTSSSSNISSSEENTSISENDLTSTEHISSSLQESQEDILSGSDEGYGSFM